MHCLRVPVEGPAPATAAWFSPCRGRKEKQEGGWSGNVVWLGLAAPPSGHRLRHRDGG